MIQKTGNDLVVIASQPAELAAGHATVIEQMKVKEVQAELELKDAVLIVQQCGKANIGVAHAKRIHTRAMSRKLFLSKIRKAMEAGYVIVPNFPGDTIAIRVSKPNPKFQSRVSYHNYPALDAAKSEALPVNEGRYVDPNLNTRTYVNDIKQSNGDVLTKYQTISDSFDEEFSLPVAFLKPTVVELTGNALTRKIFDEIAITSNAAIRDGDPMVLGRIRDRKNNKLITFLVAWFLDTKEI